MTALSKMVTYIYRKCHSIIKYELDLERMDIVVQHVKPLLGFLHLILEYQCKSQLFCFRPSFFLRPPGRQWRSRVLALARPSPGCGRYMESEPDRIKTFSFSLSL